MADEIGYLGAVEEINDVSVQEYHDQKNRYIMHQYNKALNGLACNPLQSGLGSCTLLSSSNQSPPWEKQNELLLLTIKQGD